MTVALDLRCGGAGRVTQGTGHSMDRYPAGLTHSHPTDNCHRGNLARKDFPSAAL